MPWAAIANIVAVAILAVTVGTPQGRRQLATAAAVIAAWMIHTLFRIAPTVAVVFADALVTSFDQNRTLWAQVVSIFVRELTGGDIDASALAAVQQGGPLGAAAGQIFRPLIQSVEQIIAPTGALTPDQGVLNLESAFGAAAALGLQGWWVSAVGDMVSLGKFGAAADLPDAIERGIGLNRLGRLVWRTPVKKAIQEPLEEHYNRIYRFTKLTLGEATTAWHRGQIDDATFLDYAAAHGYSDTLAAQLLAAAAPPYPTVDVTDMSYLLGLSDEVLLPLLREQGFNSGRAQTILDLNRARKLQTVLTEMASLARSAFRSGKLTVDQLTVLLHQANYTDQEVGVVLATEALLKGTEKVLDLTQLLTAYRDQVLDAPEVRLRLQTLGYQDPDIDVLFALQRKQVSTGQILEAVMRGKLTADQATSQLVKNGYTQADAELLVSLKGRVLTEGQVMDALRQGLINIQDATTDLEQLGFDPDQIAILLAFQRKQLSPADVQAAILKGVITPEDGVAKLIALGYSQADAQIIVTLRRRLMTVTEILAAYVDGLITRVDTLGDLQARGLSADDALAVVRVFEEKQVVAAQKASAAAAKAAAPKATPAPPAAGTGGTAAGP